MENDYIGLAAGERVLWKGRPQSGIIFQSRDMTLVPFSLMWGGFAIFWNITVWKTDANLMFKLFGLPFLVMGIYIMVGRFFVDARARKATRYYVTNQRIVIVTGLGRSSIKSLEIKRLPMIELQERSDGAGTIRFAEGAEDPASHGSGSRQPTLDTTPQFVRIADVRRVYELIRREAGKD